MFYDTQVIMMDSIERMRRINDLTRELKQHGFAESSFEAIKQANQIYGDDDVDEQVKHGLIQNSPHDKMMKDENVVENMDENAAYNERKLAKVNDNVELLTTKMNEIIRALNDLDARIAEVKLKQDKFILERQEQRVEPRVEVKVETSVEEKPASQGTRQESKVEGHVHTDEYTANQRTGNFQSQDVAIDKMFYFGKK
jgi:hypothetical protein